MLPLRPHSCVTGLCPFDRHDSSRNSTALLPFARPKSKMRFERGLSDFSPCLFRFGIPSQKPSFLREIRLGIEGRLWVETRHSRFARNVMPGLKAVIHPPPEAATPDTARISALPL